MATSPACFRTARRSSICQRLLQMCCLWLLLLLMLLTAGCTSSEGTEATASHATSGADQSTPAEQLDGMEAHSTTTSVVTSVVAGQSSSISTSLRQTSTTLSLEPDMTSSTTTATASSTTTAATSTTTAAAARTTTTQPPKPSVSSTQPPAVTSTTAPAPKDPFPLSCTFLIDCNNAVKAGLVSNRTILDRQTVKFKDGETVFTVLKRLLDNKGIPMASDGSGNSAYVVHINGLAEFDGGPASGWMYSVNGWYPNYSCGAYVLKEGDAVEWRYTCSQGGDL
jgi:hypothetical protein